MCIALVGGIKGIERDYKKIAKRYNVKYKIFNQNVPDFCKKIKNVDMVVLCTGTVSHSMALNCNKVCKKNNIKLERVVYASLSKLEEVIAQNV